MTAPRYFLVLRTPAALDLLALASWGKELRAAMLSAQPEPIPGAKSGAQLLLLPGGVPWPQLGAVPLFVRHFYQACYEGAMRRLQPGKRFFVRGNGGSELACV